MVGISRLKVQAISASKGQEDQWGQLEARQEALTGAAHLLNWVWVDMSWLPWPASSQHGCEQRTGVGGRKVRVGYVGGGDDWSGP